MKGPTWGPQGAILPSAARTLCRSPKPSKTSWSFDSWLNPQALKERPGGTTGRLNPSSSRSRKGSSHTADAGSRACTCAAPACCRSWDRSSSSLRSRNWLAAGQVADAVASSLLVWDSARGSRLGSRAHRVKPVGPSRLGDTLRRGYWRQMFDRSSGMGDQR